ncbi:hypothetical protein PHLGIDRAFT_153984 [Phlebiopsis gigantea 11061_1 CR5-6]|uniref:Uncharacterized protein n=1 Tax=Phlebiopsis gigantea (strain 11061_1 CR5-6) TaxID=745531 RepID=A0A0C3S8G9_PHLG1|nr:hypothetical protein PHLGIDRAFT_153984 [Phlebiopsis gigantea 11061_1 CR5-6]
MARWRFAPRRASSLSGSVIGSRYWRMLGGASVRRRPNIAHAARSRIAVARHAGRREARCPRSLRADLAPASTSRSLIPWRPRCHRGVAHVRPPERQYSAGSGLASQKAQRAGDRCRRAARCIDESSASTSTQERRDTLRAASPINIRSRRVTRPPTAAPPARRRSNLASNLTAAARRRAISAFFSHLFLLVLFSLLPVLGRRRGASQNGRRRRRRRARRRRVVSEEGRLARCSRCGVACRQRERTRRGTCRTRRAGARTHADGLAGGSTCGCTGLRCASACVEPGATPWLARLGARAQSSARRSRRSGPVCGGVPPGRSRRRRRRRPPSEARPARTGASRR